MLAFLGVAVSLASAPTSALAQTAPAGNAHPDTEMLDPDNLPNPLGVSTEPDPMTPQQKHIFAEKINLAPLRDAAVYHNGRVKILDTLARETITAITGRHDYLDLIPVFEASGKVKSVQKLHYDPLFTFFDLIASPTYYFDKPLVHVTYLPARRALIEASVSDTTQQNRWMKLTRLSPQLITDGFSVVAEKQGTDPQVARALNELRTVADLLWLGHNNLLLVIPTPGSNRWRHVAQLPATSPLRTAFTKMGDGWRAGDADRVNAQIILIADQLQTLNQGADAPARRHVEAFYNRAHPFDVGAWLYMLAFVSLLLAFGTGWRAVLAIGITALVLAMSAHAFGFGARWYIAQRLPIQNQFESMTGLALGGAIVGMVIMLIKRQWLFGAAASAVGFIILLAATQTGVPGETIGREAAILNTSWLLKYHVSTVLVSYGMITLGAIVSSFYLALYYLGKRKAGADDLAGFATHGLNLDDSVNTGRQRLLRDLDRAQMTVLQLAFWALGVGILLGAWWADHSWGRWWAFDPKETWALLTWVIYLIVVHVRVAMTGNRGLVTAWLSLVGFIVMLWTYFGVNLLLPGLHAYA